jgi:DivIVA domain-containing protein
LEYLLLFLAVLVAGAAVFLSVGRWRRPTDVSPRTSPAGEILGLAEPLPTLPPVLLPERPTGTDIAGVRLGVGLRGYRCDQVDAVLEALAGEIDLLNAELDDARRGPVISATNHSPE